MRTWAHVEGKPRGDAGRRWTSASQDGRLAKKPQLCWHLEVWQAPSFQNCEEIHLCVCGILLWQPEHTNTHILKISWYRTLLQQKRPYNYSVQERYKAYVLSYLCTPPCEQLLLIVQVTVVRVMISCLIVGCKVTRTSAIPFNFTKGSYCFGFLC